MPEFQNGYKDVQPTPDSELRASTGPIVAPEDTEKALPVDVADEESADEAQDDEAKDAAKADAKAADDKSKAPRATVRKNADDEKSAK